MMSRSSFVDTDIIMKIGGFQGEKLKKDFDEDLWSIG